VSTANSYPCTKLFSEYLCLSCRKTFHADGSCPECKSKLEDAQLYPRMVKDIQDAQAAKSRKVLFLAACNSGTK